MINCIDCDTLLSGRHYNAQRCKLCAHKRRSQQMAEYYELRSSVRYPTGKSIERRASIAGVSVEEKRRTEELFLTMKQKMEAMNDLPQNL